MLHDGLEGQGSNGLAANVGPGRQAPGPDPRLEKSKSIQEASLDKPALGPSPLTIEP
jgi:hypothetical protein